MKVRNISDPVGSFQQTENTKTANGQEGAANAAKVAQPSAEATKLAEDFGTADPAEEARRAQRVQELKAQNAAGTLKPANSTEVAKKIIEELAL